MWTRLGEPGPGGLPPSLPGLMNGHHSTINADVARGCPEPMARSPVTSLPELMQLTASGRGICYDFNFIKEGAERGNAASPTVHSALGGDKSAGPVICGSALPINEISPDEKVGAPDSLYVPVFVQSKWLRRRHGPGSRGSHSGAERRAAQAGGPGAGASGHRAAWKGVAPASRTISLAPGLSAQ